MTMLRRVLASTNTCVLALVAFAFFPPCVQPATAADEGPSAAEVSTRRLLDALDEKKLPDVTLWVLERVEKDPDSSAELKKEVPIRRAAALVGTTRFESDSNKRAAILTKAENEIDLFLGKSPTGELAIAAYTQKGNLLIERGRAKVEQAKRAGADAPKVLSDGLPFFDAAIKSLEAPTRKPNAIIDKVSNAEDAVLKELRAVDKEIAASRASEEDDEDGEKKPKKPARKSAADIKRIERLEERQDALRGQLLQTRLLVGGAYYEKSRALPLGSPDWKQAIETSAAKYKVLYEKYRSRGAGLFARYYEGRNYAALALAEQNAEERKKLLGQALTALADIRSLEGEAGFVPGLRAKAINSSLECWLDAKAYADKEFKDFDERLLKIATTKVSDGNLDADWLGLKYRSALMLERRVDAMQEGVKGKPLLQNAKKLALEVAKFNKDYAAEARALLEQLGKALPDDGSGGEESFEASMDAARMAMQYMQSRQAEMKQAIAAGKSAEAEQARQAAAVERDKAMKALRRAIPLAAANEIEALNQARSMLTFLNYDARRLYDAAALGSFLADRYPNARGSRQAAKIAMASWQMLSKEGPVEWRGAAKNSCADIAAMILQTWPQESESADAALIAIASAMESRNPEQLLSVIGMVPAAAPRRGEVLLRGGPALWREVLDKRRLEEGVRPAEEVLADWKQKATQAIDEGLATIPAGTKPDKATVAAAISRCQIAIDDGDSDLVARLLEQPDYGPWTVVNGQDPTFTEGAIAESTLSLALRYFIQSEKLDKAQQAMDRLEVVAGVGEEASAKLTAMYLSMGLDLQAQLDELGSGDKAGTPEAQAKTMAILSGFEKFLDGVAKRDQKVSSQMWVATTYLSLGSGAGAGSVVPRRQAEGYLSKAAEVYEKLLASGEGEIARFEPSIRLKMASVYRELGKWDEAQGHIDWLLSDAKRQNSLETQVEAAELLQAAGEKSAGSDKAKAEQYFKQAIAGRKEGGSVIWGWGGIANKLARQAFAGSDEKSLEARVRFFAARLNVARCRLERARVSEADREKLLQMAVNDIAITYKLYPELGGPSMSMQFDKLLKDIERDRGNGASKGLADLKKAQAAEAVGGP
jgi:hypothetical protein